MLTFNTKDTQTITRTYELLQKLNTIVCGIIAFASLILTFVIAADDEVLWLLPAAVLLITALVFVVISNILEVKFGMYYDIRITRLNAENKNNINTATVDDTLPEL